MNIEARESAKVRMQLSRNEDVNSHAHQLIWAIFRDRALCERMGDNSNSSPQILVILSAN